MYYITILVLFALMQYTICAKSKPSTYIKPKAKSSFDTSSFAKSSFARTSQTIKQSQSPEITRSTINEITNKLIQNYKFLEKQVQKKDTNKRNI